MSIKEKLPVGRIFNQSEKLDILLKSFEKGLIDLCSVTKNNITDLDPRKTVSYIGEWARLLNITEAVNAIPDIEDKRSYIVNKLTVENVRTGQYFIDLIFEKSGYTAVIDPYPNSEAGEMEAGDSVQSDTGYTIKFTIATVDNDVEIEYAEAGGLEAGDMINAHGIFDVESFVDLEFPMILNIVFEYDDGTGLVRSFSKQG